MKTRSITGQETAVVAGCWSSPNASGEPITKWIMFHFHAVPFASSFALSWGICRQQSGPNVTCSVQETNFSIPLCCRICRDPRKVPVFLPVCSTQGHNLQIRLTSSVLPLLLPYPATGSRHMFFLACLPFYLGHQSPLTSSISPCPVQPCYQNSVWQSSSWR